MSKNIIVNGKTHTGVSFLEVLTTAGVVALFKDMDEASGGSLPGLAEVASGTFTVEAAKMGGKDSGNADYLAVAHGLSGAPDGFAVVPKYLYDTVDNNLFGEVYNNGWNIAGGRRSVEGNTSHVQVNNATGVLVDDTNIYPIGVAFAKFQPTYKDNAGNEGQQEYIWIAWRNAE